MLRAVATEIGNNGLQVLIGVNQFGDVFRRRQNVVDGFWDNYTSMGFIDGRSVTLARNADGHLEAFVVTAGGAVAQSFETSPGSNVYTPWNFGFGLLDSDGIRALDVSAHHNADGRVELFMVTVIGELFHRWQLSGGGWSNWAEMSLPRMPGTVDESTGAVTSYRFARLVKIAVADNNDGRLTLIGLDHDNQVWRRRQISQNVTADSGWSSWETLGGRMTQVTGRKDSRGVIKLIGVDHLGQLWTRKQSAVDADTWTPWSLFSSTLFRPEVPVMSSSVTEPMTRVPNLSGLTEMQANQALSYAGLTHLATPPTQLSATAAPGTVISQNWAPGQQVTVGTTVSYVLAAAGAVVPNITHRTLSDASVVLRGAGLVVGNEHDVDTIDCTIINTIAGQSPASGQLVPRGSAVNFDLWKLKAGTFCQ
jgi:hypothetical protein